MNARSFSINDISYALDEGAKFIQGEIGVLRNRTSLSTVLNQRQYTLASTVQEPLVLEYWDSSGAHQIDSQTEDQFRNYAAMIRTGTIPQSYTFLETERVLLLNPIPDTAAGTTTLTGSHNASVTTLTVASTTGFPTEGRLIIESEVVSYTSTTSTTFTGVTRGIEGTTAATHAGSTTVTERDLLVWGKRLWQDREMRTYYTTGTVAITYNTTALAGTSTVWQTPANVAAGDYFGITANATTTAPVRWYKISSVTSDTAIVLSDTYVEATQTTGTYIISSPNPFPNYCDPVLTAYAVSTLLKKTGPAGQAQAGREWATVERFLATAKRNNLKNNTVLYPRPLVAPRRTQRMGVTQGLYRIP